MPDETQENKESEKKKKPSTLRIIGKIIKWLALAILAFLMVAALCLQAPWKVIILLVVTLFACTALPRAYRKWFWASVGVIIIALIIWVFLPDDTEGWRPYTFDEELAALKAKRAIPDSENAATIYNQLLQNYDRDEFEPNLPDPNVYYLTRSEPWSSEDYPEMAQWLKGQESTIATLMRACEKDACRFPIDADLMKLGHSMDRQAAMRPWAYLLVYAANNDIREGRIKQAIEKGIGILRMSEHQHQQTSIVDFLVGNALEALGYKQFNRVVMSSDAAEKHLTLIEKAASEIKHDWSTDLPRILEREKLILKNLVGIFYEVNQKGKTRLTRDPFAQTRVYFKEQLEKGEIEDEKLKEASLKMLQPSYLQKKLMKACVLLYWFYVPSTPQKAGEIIDVTYGRIADPEYDWQKEPRKFSLTSIKFNYRYWIEYLADIIEPTYRSIHNNSYLRVLTDKRGTQLLIALRRYKNQYGHWPESLDDVKELTNTEVFIDPFNGGSFAYKLTDDNFMLYSKGKNGIDEGGRREKNIGASCAPEMVDEECDDLMIWPWGSKRKENAGGQQQ